MKKILMNAVIVSLTFIFARDLAPIAKTNPAINSNKSSRHIEIDVNSPVIPSTREEIILYEEDFEGDVSGWQVGNGWELSTEDFHSSTTSFNSPDNNDTDQYASYDLFSPTISLPYLGDDEFMHFKFWLYCDQPDFNGVVDGDNQYIADHYRVAIMDPTALAWHASSSLASESLDGNSYWCADENFGGYLDNWIQFLDTPSFTVPENGILTADMMWTIESDVGASIAGSCTDGWDAANVRISDDGGNTWSLLTADGTDIDPTANAYDFDCGYGWINNDLEYDTGGSLNHLAAGWGNNKDWTNMSFDLSTYSGEEVIVRFAFGSDPAFSTIDNPDITGVRVDNIVVSGALDCTPETDCDIVANGEVWVEQFYDYGDIDQPGVDGWEAYLPGLPFNGNMFMDISNFAGQDIIFRFQTNYDGDHTTETGEFIRPGTGLWIDDLTIYKESGGTYPAPQNLVAEAGDSEVMLSWDDMNASGTQDFIYDNDELLNPISMVSEDAEGWAGTSFVFGAPSTVNSVFIYHDASNPSDYDMDICAFGTIGTLYSPDPVSCIEVNTINFIAGWNELVLSDFGVSWEMSGSYIIGHTFSSTYAAFLDQSISWTNNHSYFNFTAPSGLGVWDPELSADGSFEGEWGIRANITFEGANVTYNVYRDDVIILSNLSDNSHMDYGLENNTTYEYTVSATYGDGLNAEESGPSNMVSATPQSNTVHEDSYDDESNEDEFNAGPENSAAVRFSADDDAGEDLLRIKWYQTEDGGGFYLKVWEDDDGVPASEHILEAVVAGDLFTGWNEKDISEEGLIMNGDFWIGVKEFSSSSPFGLDTSSDAGHSYYTVDDWANALPISGNLMFRVFLDGGGDCSASDIGDVNADGSTNIQDIMFIVNFIIGANFPTPYEVCAGDLNADGSANIQDIILIINSIFGD